ncbi:cell division protein ZapA [Lunatimonas lonarensis]|nr:cell division protein ZapA [Lunatimonas lonarensis]
METLSIRIKIGDREYPMKVKAQDEGKIRRAGKLINEKLKRYREEFGLDDRQDLLAMVAFDSMVEALDLHESNAQGSEEVRAALTHINAEISAIL